jgi:UDP-N-acetylmuramate-alanine ligase
VAGAVLQNYNSNFSYGDGHYFVFEGDEYKSQFDDPTPKFHYYKPDVLVLNNLEYDHPDIFSSLDALIREFGQLITDLPKDGLIIYNADDANLTKLVHQSNITSCSFGLDNTSDFKAGEIKFTDGYTEFQVHNAYSKNLILKDEDYKIQLPGRMNVYNALAVIATLRVLGFDYEQIALELLSYKGVKRRFEIVGVKNGITIVDDYAHHPTAVRETLEAARLKYPDARIWSVFEPHTFSRTKATLPDLAKAFGAADEILISEIYPARESIKDATTTSQEVIDAVKNHNSKFQIPNSIRLVHDKQEALNIIKTEAKSGDVIIIMAVGSFNRLAYELKEFL